MTPDPPPTNFSEQLADLSARGLRRRLREVESRSGTRLTVEGRQLICFSSNDYLGLAHHPRVVAAAREALDHWGWGAGASRLVSGHTELHRALETRLAAFKRTEAALVCSTGYQANLAAVRGLAGPGDVLLIDKRNHASIVDAARGSGAKLRVFGHRDYGRLEELLGRSAGAGRRVIVTDSLFSMDGDFADLPRLVELKHRYDALLCVDEAHATGVYGPGGRGLAEMMGVEAEIDVVVGTLSKALGGMGGFVAASAVFIDWLVNRAGAFVYTTALPPAACGAARAALDLVEAEPDRRGRLLSLAASVRSALGDRRGLDLAGSSSPIVPVVVGDAAAAVRLSQALEQASIFVPAIRPPTVPAGSARLRISLSADHTREDVDRLLAALDRHLDPSATPACGKGNASTLAPAPGSAPTSTERQETKELDPFDRCS